MTAKVKSRNRSASVRNQQLRKEPAKKSYCAPFVIGPATKFVAGEPSCEDHVEQVYEHQVEDYTISHLVDNEWRKN
jgi:hypothetical protein